MRWKEKEKGWASVGSNDTWTVAESGATGSTVVVSTVSVLVLAISDGMVLVDGSIAAAACGEHGNSMQNREQSRQLIRKRA